MQMEQPNNLPNLPGMFFRSLFTVARKDEAVEAASEIAGVYRAVAFSEEQLQRYHQAFGGFISEVPLTLVYCLAQRVHLAQMLSEDFPWPAPGLVHVSNSIEQHLPVNVSQGFVMQATVKLPARGPKVSPRRLRPVFKVEFWQDDQLIITCTSQYQVMPKQNGKPTKKREKKVTAQPGEDWQAIDTWHLDAASGRQYARLSGDFNPIHLHPLVSRWFGFNKPIIHGMYMAGRAQAEIERAAGKAIKRIDVTFKRPVPLPASISLWQKMDTENLEQGYYQVCGNTDNLQRLEGRFQFD